MKEGYREMFKSNTYGTLELKEIPSKILNYMQKMKEYDIPLSITVGTDSQNFDKTKIVSVIAVTCEGHGGIFFYEINRIKKISDVRLKLTEETTRSLAIMTELVEILEKDEYKELRENSTLAIHVDAGWSDKGKTKELIPMLVGWIKSCGYDCAIKPASYCASSIADRLSK